MRIASKLKYQYDIEKSLVFEQLESAVQEGLILKINHNGMFTFNDSYYLKKTATDALRLNDQKLHKCSCRPKFFAFRFQFSAFR